MNDFNNLTLDEKETIIHFDYLNRIVNVYSTRVPTMSRTSKSIGNPTVIHTTNGKIDSMEWTISFDDRKDIRKALSLGNLIPFK